MPWGGSLLTSDLPRRPQSQPGQYLAARIIEASLSLVCLASAGPVAMLRPGYFCSVGLFRGSLVCEGVRRCFMLSACVPVRLFARFSFICKVFIDVAESLCFFSMKAQS